MRLVHLWARVVPARADCAHGGIKRRLMLRRSARDLLWCADMHLQRDKPVGRFSAARLFRPNSVVVIGGASAVGAQLTANVEAGGYKGQVSAADVPEAIAALPSAPDLAV